MMKGHITNKNIYELTGRDSTLVLIRVPGTTWDEDDKQNFVEEDYWIYTPLVDGKLFSETLGLDFSGTDGGSLLSGFIEENELTACLNALMLKTDAGLGIGRIPLFGNQSSKYGMVVTVLITELQEYFVWSSFRYELLPREHSASSKPEPSYAAFRHIGPYRFPKEQYIKAIMDCMP